MGGMPRYRLRALLLVVAALALAIVIVRQVAIWISIEDRVFESVQVGDTEQRLIKLFDKYGIRYKKNNDPPATVYTHSDGFMGICIYYVEKGRVTAAVKD